MGTDVPAYHHELQWSGRNRVAELPLYCDGGLRDLRDSWQRTREGDRLLPRWRCPGNYSEYQLHVLQQCHLQYGCESDHDCLRDAELRNGTDRNEWVPKSYDRMWYCRIVWPNRDLQCHQ